MNYMFELELISLINEYKKSFSDYDKKQVFTRIENLVLEKSQKFETFIMKNNSSFDEDTNKIILILKEEIKNKKENLNSKDDTSDTENTEIKNTQTDFDMIKNVYEKWLVEFRKNLEENPNCQKMIKDLVNYYMPNNFQTIKKIFDINDNQDFENFKNMIKNYLRIYYVSKIKEYRTSEQFNSMNFFKKFKIKKEIHEIYQDLGKYVFEDDRINKLIGGKQ